MNLETLKINNVFGIKPTFNHEAAGLDFYIPNINTDNLNENEVNTVLTAFSKSFGKTVDELKTIKTLLNAEVSKTHGDKYNNQELNVLHLFLSISNEYFLEIDIEEAVTYFCRCYLLFDKGVAGMCVEMNDHVKINSGIKMDIPSGLCGLYVNKSGRGTKGWDVRAQLVDPDYAGYVHMSLAFTSDITPNSEIYCGDKLSQMVILPYVVVNDIEEISDEDYTELKSNSKRGENGFGSSNEKH